MPPAERAARPLPRRSPIVFDSSPPHPVLLDSTPARLRLAAALLLAACSRGDGAVTTAHAEGESSRTALRPAPDAPLPKLPAGRASYTVQPVTDGGTVTGSVELDGALPIDTTIAPPENAQRACGTSFVDRALDAKGGRLAGVAVWLEGVTHGKALPELRRHEVAIAGCRLEPRVQTVALGGTLHVHSQDRLQSLIKVLRWPAGETAATVTTNDDGEVVPDDRVLGERGALELRGVQPSWMRAWVLVLDHPYATTTAAAGTFSLDSVPPGTYTLVAWHDRLGRVEQPITIAAGQTQSVTIRMHAAAPNAPDTAPARR